MSLIILLKFKEVETGVCISFLVLQLPQKVFKVTYDFKEEPLKMICLSLFSIIICAGIVWSMMKYTHPVLG